MSFISRRICLRLIGDLSGRTSGELIKELNTCHQILGRLSRLRFVIGLEEMLEKSGSGAVGSAGTWAHEGDK